jgi:ATP-dependent RNA helicase DDX52/ROK1
MAAPTGSGKTLAFLIPLLLSRNKYDSEGRSGTSESSEEAGPLAVVLEPTRELARQVADEARKIGAEEQWRVAVGGEDANAVASSGLFFSQVLENRREADGGSTELLVTTPNTLIWAVKEKRISLSR